MDNELVVSDCEVPTPELSLITSDAVSPRLLSRNRQRSDILSVVPRVRPASPYRAINAMQEIEILKRVTEKERKTERKRKNG